MRPKPLDESIWTLESPLRSGPLELGARTSLIRLPDGGLVAHSPGPLGPETAAEIAALGPVRALIAPNSMHHLFLGTWLDAFPDAQCFAARGVAAKQPGLELVEVGAAAPALLGGALESCPLEGMPALNEIAFFHPASRSLLLTDLCFHLRRGPWLTRLLLRINQAWDRFGPSRICRSMVKDRGALRASLDVVLAWEFERVVVCHGDVLESGGRDALREAFAWLDTA